VAGLLKFIRTF